ncbi:hypothetical protein AAV96_03300 [Acinetobacter sp. AG1]|uniref:hypothetical protein n=1 Tax=Acinetobacter TaxID=469 RepID=UPI000629C045|nr:hypothetical protein [Acinetobacter sp. AG1]KKW81549.1 hypothetical protein AAV96_03300 [Acinetobacter sp. AG1]
MNRIYIILGVVVLVMIGVVWKSNSDRKAREEALAQQTQQYNQKMSQLEAENQARLAQEVQRKAQQEQARIEYNNRAKSEQTNFEKNHQTISNQATVVNKAEDVTPKHKYSDEEWMSICKSTSKTARVIMNSRQKGASMSDMMDRIMAVDTAVEIKNIIKPFILMAYNKPRFSTPEYMLKAEVDFENEAYLTCMSARS